MSKNKNYSRASKKFKKSDSKGRGTNSEKIEMKIRSL
jgi:hypothetical protein